MKLLTNINIYNGGGQTNCILQVGNIVKPRKNVDNPQEGRIYSINGISPTLSTAHPCPKIIEEQNNE